MTTILEGVRVLDFGRYIAGPWCGAMLGDLGAEVIRIEKVDGGEDRFLYPLSEDGSGSMFMQCNRNKKGMTLNPLKPEGRAIQEQLVATADVVIANMPPRALEQLGLDYASLTAIKPDIILTTNTAFGTVGPYARKVGFDSVAQAMSGNMVMSGEPDAPTKSLAPWVDYNTAALCAFGTLAAIMHRTATGEGQEVQGALLLTALTATNSLMSEQHVIQRNRPPLGNLGQTSAPSDLFHTKDGHVYVVAVGQPMFERWAKLMGKEDWLKDPRFKDDDSRSANARAISDHLQEWCENRTTEEVMATLEKHRIPVAPVYTLQESLDDPHVQGSGMLTEIDYPGMPRPAPLTETPVRLQNTPGGIRMRAPQLGEHTDDILVELGYKPEQIEALHTGRVV